MGKKGGWGGRKRKEEEREGEGETRHTSPSLLPASLRPSVVSCRSFPVAASVLWNSLPLYVQSSSLHSFRQRLKSFRFHKSFPYCLFACIVWLMFFLLLSLTYRCSTINLFVL